MPDNVLPGTMDARVVPRDAPPPAREHVVSGCADCPWGGALVEECRNPEAPDDHQPPWRDISWHTCVPRSDCSACVPSEDRWCEAHGDADWPVPRWCPLRATPLLVRLEVGHA